MDNKQFSALELQRINEANDLKISPCVQTELPMARRHGFGRSCWTN